MSDDAPGTADFPAAPAVTPFAFPAGTPPAYEAPVLRPRYGLAFTLLALTFFTTTTLGSVLAVWSRGLPADEWPWLAPGLVLRVWSEPRLLTTGLAFSLPVLTILLCHEMGHYLACRRYRLAATLPYFLPLPVMLGTLGAFIRIRSPLRDRRQLFDVGVAGPLAGFAALLPFLAYGVAHSSVVPLAPPAGLSRLVPGPCLALDLAVRLFHAPLPPDAALALHPTALAAWFGLLATAINLLPLGQLDGGHLLYALVGRRRQRRLAVPLWLALAATGFFWGGWLVWCGVVLLMGLFHPPVVDETAPLGRSRQLVAALALLILVLSFMPRGAADVGGDAAPPGASE
ncbi:MAG TPA: site-2 protease family protein, partial [Thermoanaerobaculia bacterium]